MVPTQDQVRHAAKLARLALSDEEVETYQGQLASIFGYIDKLSEAPLDSDIQAHHASRDMMHLRTDTVEMTDAPNTLISSTQQEIIGGHIALPNIMKRAA